MVTMKDKALLNLLLKNGWELTNVKGSHHRLKKGNQVEVIPVHGKDSLWLSSKEQVLNYKGGATSCSLYIPQLFM